MIIMTMKNSDPEFLKDLIIEETMSIIIYLQD